MNTSAASNLQPLTAYEQFRLGRQILRSEGEALLALADRIDQAEFCRALELLLDCTGRVIVSGMGKAGLVGQKIAATLASTGAASHFLHPAEAIHGDLGRIHPGDVLLMLSYSGETEEVVRLLPALQELNAPIIAVTGDARSALARAAEVLIDLGSIDEAGCLGLAPSTTTTAMLATGDALALVLSRIRRFNADDFSRLHPGGSLGRKLARVEELMRPLDQCRLAEQNETVREVFVALSRPGRRSGAIMATDRQGVLSGIFTDSDLARLLENNRDAAFDGPLRDVMTHQPKSVPEGSKMSAALAILAEGKISELPVVDECGKPVGLVDITDVVGLLPRASLTQSSKSTGVGPPSTLPFRTNR